MNLIVFSCVSSIRRGRSSAECSKEELGQEDSQAACLMREWAGAPRAERDVGKESPST